MLLIYYFIPGVIPFEFLFETLISQNDLTNETEIETIEYLDR